MCSKQQLILYPNFSAASLLSLWTTQLFSTASQVGWYESSASGPLNQLLHQVQRRSTRAFGKKHHLSFVYSRVSVRCWEVFVLCAARSIFDRNIVEMPGHPSHMPKAPEQPRLRRPEAQPPKDKGPILGQVSNATRTLAIDILKRIGQQQRNISVRHQQRKR